MAEHVLLFLSKVVPSDDLACVQAVAAVAVALLSFTGQGC
jgi:hypothetical protein